MVERTCPRCGNRLPADAPAMLSLCPACMLSAAMEDPRVEAREDAADPALLRSISADPPASTEQLACNQLSDQPLPSIGPRFKLLEAVAEGGMGVVYKAEQRAPVHRTVAVKLIKLGMDTRQVLARFDAERQALAMLNHPNVAAVYDAGATDTGRPYFVMEWVPGEPITEFCDRHNYTTKQRLELFIQACDAIQHAHQKAIIHRDIKPSNLLVTLEGDKPLLKVIDFGVAKATAHRLTEQTMFTEQGQLIGTPEYMSPEQAEMNALDIDTRTDIYSLGVVLYELLTGAVPFDSKSLRQAAYAQIQRIIREADPPRPSTRLSSLGDSAIEVAKHRQMELSALEKQLRTELEWIPLKALRKDRTHRYSTANALADDIKNYLENKALTAGPESTAYRTRKLLRRNKGPVLAATAVLFVLLAGVIVSTGQAIRARRAEQVAAQQRDEAVAEKHRADEQTAIANAVNDFLGKILSTTGTSSATGAQVTVLEAVQIAVNRLNAGELDGKPLTEAAVRIAMSRALLQLSHGELAEPNLVKAIALRRAALGPDHLDVADALSELGGLLNEEGMFDRAEAPGRQAVEMHRKWLPKEELNYSYKLTSLATSLRSQHKFAESEPLEREALAIRERLLPANDWGIAHALGHLSSDLLMQKRFNDAEPLLRRQTEIVRKLAAPGTPASMAGVRELAGILRRQGRVKEADSLFKEVLQENRTDWVTLRSRAALLKSQGELAEAATTYRQSIDAQLKDLPPGHPDIAGNLSSCAAVLKSLGRIDEARDLCERVGKPYLEALDAQEKAHGDAPILATSRVLCGSAYQSAGRMKEAESLYQQSLAMRRRLFGESNAQVVALMVRLSGFYKAQAKTNEANQVWLDSVQIRIQKLGSADTPEARGGIYLLLVPSMLNAGQNEQAKEFCRRALQAKVTNWVLLNSASWAMLTRSDPSASDASLAVALARRAVALAPTNGDVRNTLGVALYRAGDYVASMTELHESVRLNSDKPVMSDFLFLAMASQKLGDRSTARSWYEKAAAMHLDASQNAELARFRVEAEGVLGIRSTHPATLPATAPND